ncbi:MAG: DUF3810 domain-containing protein [Ruminococcaceae bacterium]|nr:DUF3810 domain-containing protein [Oscillospiraceae bacterium]
MLRGLTRAEKLFALIGATLAVLAYLWVRLAMRMGPEATAQRRLGLGLGGLLGRLWQWTPVPMAELVWIVGVLSAVGVTVGLTARRGGWGLLGACCRLILAAGVIYALFAVVFSVQYSAAPLSEQIGLDVGRYSAEQLYETAKRVTQELNEAAEQVARGGDGLFTPTLSFREVCAACSASYRQGELKEIYARGPGLYPKQAKLLSRATSYLSLAGYYFPITGESVIGSDIMETSVPFTVAHEMAHACGVGPEKEANFMAFVVCRDSSETDVRYSGLFNGYIYLNNALYAADRDLWQSLYDGVSAPVKADLDAKTAHLQQFKGKVNDLGNKVNDAYIKTTGQADGVKSYGLVVDMIIAYYESMD